MKKNNGAVFEIAAKAPAEKKTERKPEENTSPFASKENTVIASLFPKYTPVFFLLFYCKRYPANPDKVLFGTA